MRDPRNEALVHDPLHGYIPFIAAAPAGESSERQVIDHPWVQRLRQIHQLQTAHWVFPSAEHTRFQHVLGVMHLAGQACAALYDSLARTCDGVPSQGYVNALMRMAGLLHDVGHGPFGHFLDHHLLAGYGLTHETLGARIIVDELGDLLAGIRRTPGHVLDPGETLDPRHVAWLVVRPTAESGEAPGWLERLRSLFCGLYTVDNMDFVLRDAYMSGYSIRAFDLDRLLYYSSFTSQGLTIHDRGMPALVRFIAARAELFRTLYFHRTVRSLDLSLAELFGESKDLLFPFNPAERLDEYRRFTEWSLLVDVSRWGQSEEPRRRELGGRWQQLLDRQVRWKMAAERTVFFDPSRGERSTIFASEDLFERVLREALPPAERGISLAVDLARHVHRPGTKGPAAGQNFLYDSARDEIRPLSDSELLRQIPISWRICRVYAESQEHRAAIAAALDALVRPAAADDLTNM